MTVTGTQSADQDHFGLLPFIAIMMCLLGTLLLVTMSMTAINVGAGAGEGWIPQPAAAGGKTPVLVEWDGRYATWHAEKGLQRIKDDLVEYFRGDDGRWVRLDATGGGEFVAGPAPQPLDPLIDYLESRRDTHYALLAVRPSGFGSFYRFQMRFAHHKIPTGAEPVDQARPVRLILPGG
jgi:hypothetical protein